MKTFETEKNNIPEGATHYSDETRGDYFAWIKFVDGKQWRMMPHSWCYKDWRCENTNKVKQIPQPKEVELVNGDECLYLNKRECIFIGMRMNSKTHCIVETKNNSTYMPVNVKEISKPESPEEKEKRDKLEAAYDLYLLRCNAVNHPITYEFNEFKLQPDAVDGWLAIVDKTGYTKKGGE